MLDQFISPALLRCVSLRNTYDALRHARAESNMARKLISTCKGYSLVEEGRQELVEKTLRQQEIGAPCPDIIICSELPRALESAHLRAQVWGRKPVVIPDPRLNERNWKKLEGEPEDRWREVLHHDQHSLTSHPLSECVASLFQRASDLIVDCETKYTGKRIELLSHADMLQVIQLIFDPGQNINHYSDISYLANAEHRQLTFVQRKTAAEAAVKSVLLQTAGARGDAGLAGFEL